jgi:TolA-binding protein
VTEELRDRIARELDGALVREAFTRQARARVLAAADGVRAGGRARRRRVALALGLAAPAVAVAVALAIRPGPAEAPAGFTVGRGGAPGVVGAPLVAQEAPLPLRFAAGPAVTAEVTLAPRAAARVAALGRRGSRLVLAGGRADVHVVPRPHARWEVQAGPFAVLVTGTRFSVGWEPGAGTFQLTMQEGAIELSGGCAGEAPRRVVAGETVTRTCPPPQAARPAAPPAEEEVPPPRPAPAVRRAPPPRAVAAAGPRPARTDEVSGWRALVAAGRYREAIAAVERQGFDSACETLPEAELLRLGSAARLADDEPRARAAFGALRRRFPGRDGAAVAAFTLGRMALERRGAFAEATRWFETYLAERPRGPLAGDARGRLVEAAAKGGDQGRAQRHAREYLRLHPDGSYAPLARSLLPP